MRRLVSISGWALLWTGLGLLGWVGFQLWGTDLINARSQAQAAEVLEQVLDERRQELPPPVSTTSPTTSPPSPSEPPPPSPRLQPEPEVDEGDPLGTVRIPSIGVEEVVFGGVTPETLRLGPGHMPWTVLPGQPGNAVISGHRVTYGRPFYDLDLVEEGDVITVETAIGVHEYTVREQFVVSPTDVWVTDPRRGAWLTITTCNPRHSARERLIVVAELTDGPNLDYVQAEILRSIDEPA